MNTKFIFLCLSSLCVSNIALAQQTNIKNIDNNIATIQQELKVSSQKKEVLQQALQKTEVTETHLNQSLKNVQKKLHHNQNTLTQLKSAEIPLKKARDAAMQQLKIQLQRAYMMSQEPGLQILLSQDGVVKAQQSSAYYRYLTQAQIKNIQALQKTIASYDANQTAIQQKTTRLTQLQSQKYKDKSSLNKTRAERLQLINAIDATIKSKHDRLQSLLSYKAHLQKTIAALPSNQTFYSQQPFKNLQGRLPWPIPGQIIRRFGTPVENSELKWDGDLIGAPKGTPVRAVASGRVIFAKWMAGYGLLLILNHGNGYMSLYGRNQNINVNVGDTVKAGDTIATVGDSGGFPQSALYFSLRHNTTVLNPGTWCRKHP